MAQVAEQQQGAQTQRRVSTREEQLLRLLQQIKVQVERRS
jgi:hypothetical protein